MGLADARSLMVFDTVPFKTPNVDRNGIVVKTHNGLATRMTLDLGGDVVFELIHVPGAVFQMGSSGQQNYADAKPAHKVRVPDFWLGRHPITQAQWHALMGELPVVRFHGDELPVDGVSWHAAQRLCKRLARQTKLPFRLPSEAEWEYACRAGLSGPFAFGDTLNSDVANYNAMHTYAGEAPGPYRHTPLPVGTLPPNRFGLGEMHGSMWEWCEDAYHHNYIGAPKDGSAWRDESALKRVLRGGSWHDPPELCRSHVRVGMLPTEGDETMGIRVAISDLPIR